MTRSFYKLFIMNKRILSPMLVIVMLGAANMLYAQDPFVSQYFSSPMYLNPALIAKGVGSWRLAGTYRNQWQGTGAEPYTTAMVSVEKNLFAGSTRNDFLGAGLMVISDASNAGLLKRHMVSAGLSYNNAIDAAGKHYFGGGLSINYSRRMLDASKFVFQSQFGSGGYQPSVAANDNVPVPSSSYIDVTAGLQYSVKGDRSGFYVGASYFHANSPKDGAYSNNEYTIDPRLNLQMGYQQSLSNSGEIQLSTIFDHQGEMDRFTAGLLYKLPVEGSQLKVKTINLGVWDRFGDAIYPYIGIEAAGWLLGLSYDVPTSNVSNSLRNLQSFEISFICLFGTKKSGPVIAY
jgi:type IX secretion system PorP/SprF family membrane protein